ncbi:MAG TPA: chitobiase/beta-hexosaminidase C-terminal domain-containing protein [bacterium]|nr:chitobiase/beta-hexosaminidase C-terminal domain-containing protein [bacterium]
MRKALARVFVLGCIVGCIDLVAENYAVRNLPEFYAPGTSITVSITVFTFPQTPTNGIIVTETLPAGWTLTWSEPHWSKSIPSTNTYKWLSASQSSIPPFTITYKVNVPVDAVGTYYFNGGFSDGYSADDREITGDKSISQFTGQVATPLFSPTPDVFYNFFPDVEITTSTQDAVIHYTTDGSEPTTNSPIYSGTLHINSTTTIKAKGFKDGFQPSETAIGTYTIEIQKGDINRDRVIDISDAILCLRMSIELDVIIDQQLYARPYTDWLITVADFNSDETVDISDVIGILRKIINLN